MTFAAALTAASIHAAPAAAQAEAPAAPATAALPTNAVLPAVIVEASRLGQTPLEMPQQIRVIDRAAIADSGARDVPDLLVRESGLFAMRLGGDNPALAQITMRGYGENGFGRVLLEVDGERLDNPDLTAPNFARIPLGGVSRIEILHGPQTVLHGDAASAGMINVISDDSAGREKSYVDLRAGSHSTFGAGLGLRGGIGEDGLSYRADGSYCHSDGYRRRSGYDIWNGQGALRQDFENGSFLRLSAFYSDARYDLPGPLSAHDAAHHPRFSTYDDHTILHASGLTFSGRGVINDENFIESVFTVSRRESRFVNGDYTDIYGTRNLYGRDYVSDIWSVRFSPRYQCDANVFDLRNRFTAGGEFRWNRLHGEADEAYPAYGLVTHEKYALERLNGALFVHDELWLVEKFSVAAGARAERAWNRNNMITGKGRIDDLAAYEASANYHPAEDAKIFLRWCRFYRNPFLDEYRWVNGLRRGTTSPERGWDVSLGGEWRPNEWFVSGSLFLSETDREIHYNPFTYSNENADDAHRRLGANLAVGWLRDKVAGVRLAWSGVDAHVCGGEYDGNRVPAVPAQQLDLEGRLWLTDEFSVSAGGHLLGARYAISDFPNANGRLGSVGIFRLGCRWKPTWEWLDGFSFGLSCDNLFDKTYCDYAVASVTSGVNAWYPAAGRTFTFSVRYEF